MVFAGTNYPSRLWRGRRGTSLSFNSFLMEIVFPCQTIAENIFKGHLWGKCCNSLAFCALFGSARGWKMVNSELSAATLFYSLEKHLVLSHLRDTTGAAQESENLALVVVLKYDGL